MSLSLLSICYFKAYINLPFIFLEFFYCST